MKKKDKLKGKFIIAFDTICDGWQCVTDEKNNPTLFKSHDEAFIELFGDVHSMLVNRTNKELKEFNEGVTPELVKRMGEAYDSRNVKLMEIFLSANPNCNDNNEFVVPAEEYVHGRKAIFGKEGLKITGKKLK